MAMTSLDRRLIGDRNSLLCGNAVTMLVITRLSRSLGLNFELRVTCWVPLVSSGTCSIDLVQVSADSSFRKWCLFMTRLRWLKACIVMQLRRFGWRSGEGWELPATMRILVLLLFGVRVRNGLRMLLCRTLSFALGNGANSLVPIPHLWQLKNLKRLLVS